MPPPELRWRSRDRPNADKNLEGELAWRHERKPEHAQLPGSSGSKARPTGVSMAHRVIVPRVVEEPQALGAPATNESP